MSIKAIFPAGVTEITVNGLHQWDYGRKLEIHSADLPAEFEVHFACAGMQDAVVRVCNAVNGVTETVIPDICLEQIGPVTAWVYIINGTEGVTAKTISLPIIARPRPQITSTDPSDFSDKYTELISEVNAQVESLKAGDVTVANANRATCDSLGRIINSTYLMYSSFNEFTDALDRGDVWVHSAHNADQANTANTANTAGTATLAECLILDPSVSVNTSEYAISTPGVYIVFLTVGGTNYCNFIAVPNLGVEVMTEYVKYDAYSGCLKPYEDAGNIHKVIKIADFPVG